MWVLVDNPAGMVSDHQAGWVETGLPQPLAEAMNNSQLEVFPVFAVHFSSDPHHNLNRSAVLVVDSCHIVYRSEKDF
jgi:hypothetical protein